MSRCILLVLLLPIAAPALAQSPDDALAAGFQAPPPAALPRTWWHWTNGNITKFDFCTFWFESNCCT